MRQLMLVCAASALAMALRAPDGDQSGGGLTPEQIAAAETEAQRQAAADAEAAAAADAAKSPAPKLRASTSGVPADKGQGASSAAVADAAKGKIVTDTGVMGAVRAPRAGSGGISKRAEDAEAEVPAADGKRPVVWLQSGHPVHRMADLIMVSEEHADKLHRVGRARIARLNDVAGLKPDDLPFYDEP